MTDLDAIECELGDRIEQVGDEIGAALRIPNLGETLRAGLESVVHDIASALVESAAAGDTPEQLAERFAHLNAEES